MSGRIGERLGLVLREGGIPDREDSRGSQPRQGMPSFRY
jgi:hypothetical protein